MPSQTSKSACYSFCLSSFLYNNLQNSRDRTLIIDTRDTEDFNTRHVEGSINLTSQRLEEARAIDSNGSEKQSLNLTNLSKALRNKELSKFSNRRRCFCFLVMKESDLPVSLVNEIRRLANYNEYDDSFQIADNDLKNLLDSDELEEKDSVSNALEIFKIMQNDRVRELHILLDGASSFFARYPYLVSSFSQSYDKDMVCSSSTHLSECEFPHDILDGRLFLGSFNQSEKYSLVLNLKVTHILNMTFECENVHEDKGINYRKIAILDEDSTNIAAHFEDAFEFINKALQENENNKVLVHCAMGKSRSATIVIMYLMKKFLWNYEKAYSFVKRKREIVCPNEGFVQQLQQFESVHLGCVKAS